MLCYFCLRIRCGYDYIISCVLCYCVLSCVLLSLFAIPSLHVPYVFFTLRNFTMFLFMNAMPLLPLLLLYYHQFASIIVLVFLFSVIVSFVASHVWYYYLRYFCLSCVSVANASLDLLIRPLPTVSLDLCYYYRVFDITESIVHVVCSSSFPFYYMCCLLATCHSYVFSLCSSHYYSFSCYDRVLY